MVKPLSHSVKRICDAQDNKKADGRAAFLVPGRGRPGARGAVAAVHLSTEDKMADFENDFPRLEIVLQWLATLIKR
jgi:hypothetical protein